MQKLHVYMRYIAESLNKKTKTVFSIYHM